MSDERSEEATPQRRADARREGRVARSDDLTRVAVVGLTALLVATTGVSTAGRIVTFTTWSIDAAFRGEAPLTALRTAAEVAMNASIPFIAVVTLAALLVSLIQVGPLFTSRTIGPRADGMRRGWSPAWLDTGLDVGRALGVAGVVLASARTCAQTLVVLPRETLLDALASTQALASTLSIRILTVLLLFALLDLAQRRRALSRALRMTPTEKRDEARRSAGSPEVRRRQRQAQQPGGSAPP